MQASRLVGSWSWRHERRTAAPRRAPARRRARIDAVARLVRRSASRVSHPSRSRCGSKRPTTRVLRSERRRGLEPPPGDPGPGPQPGDASVIGARWVRDRDAVPLRHPLGAGARRVHPRLGRRRVGARPGRGRVRVRVRAVGSRPRVRGVRVGSGARGQPRRLSPACALGDGANVAAVQRLIERNTHQAWCTSGAACGLGAGGGRSESHL